MIKGINKQIVEVCETDNDYFEKAVFFVNPKYAGFDQKKLAVSAKKIIATAGSAPKIKSRKKTIFKKVISWITAIATGVAVMILMQSIKIKQ